MERKPEVEPREGTAMPMPLGLTKLLIDILPAVNGRGFPNLVLNEVKDRFLRPSKCLHPQGVLWSYVRDPDYSR